MGTIKYMLSLLVYDLSRSIFLWTKFSNYTYLWLPPALMKNILRKIYWYREKQSPSNRKYIDYVAKVKVVFKVQKQSFLDVLQDMHS